MYEPSTFGETFAKRLSDLMKAKGENPTSLAKAISARNDVNLDAGTIRRWLRAGEKLPPPAPSLYHLMALANHFNVSFDDLVAADRSFSSPGPPLASPSQLSPLMHRGQPLIRLVRYPRSYEQAGVEIARRLCDGELHKQVMADLNYGEDERRFQDDLKQAAYGDLLQVETTSIETNRELEETLQRTYDLKVCKVARVGGLQYGVLITVILGALAADYVRAKALPDVHYSVGIAGGFSCARLIVSLVQTLPSNRWVRMVPVAMQTTPERVVALDSDTLIGMFGYLSGRVDPKYSKSLGYPSNSALNASQKDRPLLGAYFDFIRKQLESVPEEVSAVFMGLGGNIRFLFNAMLSYMTAYPRLQQDLAENGCIGDVLFHFVNRDGVIASLQGINNNLACSIGLDRLQALASKTSVPVVALVADPYKYKVLRLALEKCYVNSLITTEDVARTLINATARGQQQVGGRTNLPQ